MPLGAYRVNSIARYEAPAGFVQGWNSVSSNTFTLGRYSQQPNCICYHGIVNTDQLVCSIFYTESDGGSTLYYKLRGFVVDLTTGAINLGSANDVYLVGSFTGQRYSGAVAGNGNTGVLLGINGSSYYSRLQGFTISNYSSCNQTTAPTYSLGATNDMFTGGNTLGEGLSIGYVGNNNRYVAATRGNDATRQRAFTWNGTTLTAEGSLVTGSGNGGAFCRSVIFANPGNSLNYGTHVVSSDGNGNYILNTQFASNTTTTTINNFYAAGKSSVKGLAIPIQDSANDCRSLVVGYNSTDDMTARIATTTNFTSASTSYGTAATTASFKTNQFYVLPYSSTQAWYFYKSSSSTMSVVPITWSGTTPSWGSTASTASSSFSDAFFAGFHYYNATYGYWYIFSTANTSNVGKIIAMKYVP